MTASKVKQMMMSFVDKKIAPLERNIMRGIFIRKLKDFKEDDPNKIEDGPASARSSS